MSDPSESTSTTSAQDAADWFGTTHWSVVRAAGEGATPAARQAVEQLCTLYWPPLYGYIRRRGHPEEEAKDLTQEFFARLLSRNDFATLDPAQGRFRAFLLAALKHFLANERRAAGALKRGGGQIPIPLEIVLEEEGRSSVPAAEPAPDHWFDRRWAEAVMEQAGKVLRDEFQREGRANLFQALNQFLSAPSTVGDYAGIAQRLGTTEAAIAQAVARLRRRYRDLVQREIARTVSNPKELEEEMRYLLEVLT